MPSPDFVAGRLDAQQGLRVVRRGQDVAVQLPATMPTLAVDMVDSGLLFVPAQTAIPFVASIDAARRHVLAPADRRHITGIEGSR